MRMNTESATEINFHINYGKGEKVR